MKNSAMKIFAALTFGAVVFGACAGAAGRPQWAFLLSAPPIAFTNAFGSPVNPLALK